MKDKIKIFLFCSLLHILFIGCEGQTKNKNDTTNDEKLLIYGLNAPEDVYAYFKRKINALELKEICNETNQFPIISIAIVMRDSIITECYVKSLRPVPITEKIFQNILTKKRISFTFMDNYSFSNYDFRLQLDMFCNTNSSSFISK